MKKIILCDIDGTIANNDHRQHFLQGKKDWDGFFSELKNDLPIKKIINQIIDLQSKGKKIIFITGRPERYRHSTEKWLSKYFTFEIEVIMRKDNDRKNKLVTKKEMFDLRFNSDEIYCCFENDDLLIDLWTSLGIDTIKVNQ
tara:strand:+ start:183 stop:608 length:426 start_codon:yes stop_codon:yes gene_type:complete